MYGCLNLTTEAAAALAGFIVAARANETLTITSRQSYASFHCFISAL